MKKSALLVVLGLFVAVSSFAFEVSVKPTVEGRAYNSFDTVAEVGLNVEASKLVIPYVPAEYGDNVVLSTGINWAGTKVSDTDTNVDLYTVPFTLGYNVQATKDIVVKPFVGLDLIVPNSSADVDSAAFGQHLGVEVAYQVTSNVKVGLNAGYSFASIDVNGEKEVLDGPSFGGFASYSF